MSSNFDFLLSKTIFDEFSQLLSEAEILMGVSHMSAATAGRVALEAAVKWIYKMKKWQLPIYFDESGKAFDPKLHNLIKDHKFKNFVNDSQLLEMMWTIKNIGNKPAHAVQIDRSEAMLQLKNLLQVANWIDCKFSPVGECQLHRSFNESLVPAEGFFKKQGEEFKKKIDRLQKYLDANNEEFIKQEEDLLKAQSKLEQQSKELSAKDEQIRQLLAEIERQKQANNVDNEFKIDEATEAETRNWLIDEALRQAGWVRGKNMEIEVPVQGMPISERSRDGNGFCDYVLYDEVHKPIAVVEAKRTKVEADDGIYQAVLYADCLERQYGRRPFIFATNGYKTLYLDDVMGYPRREVYSFFNLAELTRRLHQRSRMKLTDVKQNVEIAGRPYQLAAVTKFAETAEDKRRKMLIVQATGTGKTRVAVSISDILLRSEWAHSILFLADRTALVSQARSKFYEFFAYNYALCNLPEYNKDKKSKTNNPPEKSRIIFSTYPTIMNAIDAMRKADGSRFFTPGYFDLIILDESHRSIYQKYQAIFSYFDSMLLGLTATPKNDVDRNTYGIFDLPDGEPTFYYDYHDAVQQGYLVDYEAVECTTERLKNGIKYNELSAEDKEEYERSFGDNADSDGNPKDIRSEAFNKTVFNQATIQLVIRKLMEEGIHVEDGDKLGKTIIFAKNHLHAVAIVEQFHKMYPNLKEDFIQVVDYQTAYSDNLITQFEIADKMPQIAVSVDMLDTGIDVPEVVNLVFFKVVKSYSKFWQMIGRGTRLCPDLFGKGHDKKKFKIFDWGWNFDFFELPQNKMELSGVTQSLSASIFFMKAYMAYLMRTAGLAKNGESAAEELDNQCVYNWLLDELQRGMNGINPDSFVVKLHTRAYHKYMRAESWQGLAKDELKEVESEVAVMIGNQEEVPIETRRFDYLMLCIAVDALTSSKSRTHMRNMQDIVLKLQNPKLQSIPLIKDAQPFLVQVSKAEFWEKANLGSIELVRRRLRDLVPYIKVKKTQIYYTNFSDTIIEVKENVHIDVEVVSESYKQKVESYLREHKDNLAVHKLYTNKKITELELAELEHILWHELGTRDEYHQEFSDMPVGKLVRKIVGMDTKALEDEFAEFLQENRLNTNQMHFVRMIIKYISCNGFIDDNSIYQKEPFKYLGKLSVIFRERKDEWKKIMQRVSVINSNMECIAQS